MIHNYSTYRLLQAFFDEPARNFYMRQLSREIKLSQPSVLNHLADFKKRGLILKETNSLYPTHSANRESKEFKLLKRENIILRLEETGLLDYVYDSCLPDTIILFGSCALGEDIETSDIDLFVLAPEKKLILKKFEKKLKRKISVFFCKNFEKLSEELKNNIINGIILRGYLRVYD